jgi:hypothetical protein
VPRQFSWIDHRLVSNGHIEGRSHGALTLYLFLCTVADAQGISYYSDERVGKVLGFESSGLKAARDELAKAGLIAWSRPFYQVLRLESLAESAASSQVLAVRVGKVSSVTEILHRMMGKEQAP